MRLLLLLLLAAPLTAQQTPAPKPQEPAEAKPAAEEQKQEAAEASAPAPAADENISGYVDVGYRWVSGPAGNFDSYRSIVNLGEGPKLLNLDWSFQDPKKRLFDRLDVRANNWGGDPYNTARIDARKNRLYNFSFDYRNIALFNFLPSYANLLSEPGLPLGAVRPLFLNQRSFDTTRRLMDVQLDLLPGTWLVPYLAYSRNSGEGRGITDFVSGSNEYPVATRLSDKTDHFRGGVRLEMRRFHVTAEQGGTTFKDDQSAFHSGTQFGNRATPLLGQTLSLTNLSEAWRIRGDSIYSKVIVTANPIDRLDLYGQFLYSQPTTDTNYSLAGTGNFALLSALRFYSGQQDLGFAEAKQPHTSGSVGAELRITRRLRVTESWMTDRFHNASSVLLTERLLSAATPEQTNRVFASPLLELNYSQQEVNLLFDVTSRITLRGGHRYVWGDARVPASELAGGGLEQGELKRHVGLAGVNYRSGQRLSANLDYEASSGDRSYFRTSLQDYHKARARARYQLMDSLSLNGSFSILDNQNPAPVLDYEFRSRDASLGLFWTPKGGKRFTLLGEYGRSTIRSSLDYRLPTALNVIENSAYRDNAHTANALGDINLSSIAGRPVKLSLGGNFFVSSGSRPTRYYQPVGRLSVPLGKHVQWNSEWRWYGFSEPFYLYEGFRTHQFITGIRLGI
ncbi:MAG: MtrB/PioB family outer membrane beta-barrel protein [Bryobacterales bacterium]|nr:MtrB/PioB family outer membrane beta-barrel protein [Bryobacterales bacterium]